MNNKWSMIAIIAIFLLSIFNYICYVHNSNIIRGEKVQIVDADTEDEIEAKQNTERIETRIIITKVISFLCSLAGIIFVVNRFKRKEQQWQHFLIAGIMIFGTIIMLIGG